MLATLRQSEEAQAADLTAEVFVEDPFWQIVIPGSPNRRRRLVARQARLELSVARRSGRPGMAIRRGIEVVALGLWHPRPPGRRPRFPALANPPLWLAGPGALRRALRIDSLVDELTPEHPHLYLSELAVATPVRRQGLGGTLVRAAIDEAQGTGLPVHLETFREENLHFYARFGFAVTGERELPGGHRLWVLDRPRPGSSGVGRRRPDR
jgi:ribosomal protein S18 acetylase RimI-like enzyme